MKRLSIVAIAAAFAIGCGINAWAQGGSAAAPAPEFGNPPSGQIPILYNDHHVYAKPDVLKQGRVLAALVRGGTLLIPLRSMFEQMGATVSYDAASKTATVSKPGAEVKVTVGKLAVVINGETRPLDVPPILYQGAVLVPVRVISEGMGAYVQWVPDQHVVVVRYLPATPPPSPPPPAPVPTEAPTPTPSPAPTPYADLYLAGDYLISPKVYNEFSPGNTASGGSWDLHGAWEFSALHMPLMAEGTWTQYSYNHNGSPGTPNAPCNGIGGNARPGSAGCVATVGETANLNVPGFGARNSDFDMRLGMKLLKSRVYIAYGYRWTGTNYGYPQLQGFGEGIEKLPDLDRTLSWYGSWMYYPKISGKMMTGIPVQPYNLQYILTDYRLGGAYWIPRSPIFIEAGWSGQTWVNRENAPSNQRFFGPYAGIGLKFPNF